MVYTMSSTDAERYMNISSMHSEEVETWIALDLDHWLDTPLMVLTPHIYSPGVESFSI